MKSKEEKEISKWKFKFALILLRIKYVLGALVLLIWGIATLLQIWDPWLFIFSLLYEGFLVCEIYFNIFLPTKALEYYLEHHK